MKRRPHVLLLLLAITPLGSARADQCSDILALGIPEILIIDQKAIDYSALQAYLCSNHTFTENHSSDLGLDALTPKGNFDLDFSNSDKKTQVDQLCTYSWHETFENHSLEVFSQKASAVVVKAWQECMTASTLVFSAQHSDDYRSVELLARMRIPGLSTLNFASSKIADQIVVTPPNALRCPRGFKEAQEDAIACDRLITDQTVRVRLLAKKGGSPEVLLPARVKPLPPPTVPDDLFLSKELLVSSTGIGSAGPAFGPISGGGQAFSHGVYMHPYASTGLLVFAIPPKARHFRGMLLWYSSHCDTYHPRDPAEVTVRLGSEEIGKWTVVQFDGRLQQIDVDISKLATGAPRQLQFSVNQLAYGACDQVGLGDPFFSFAKTSRAD